MHGGMCVEIVEAQTDNVPMLLWRKFTFDLLIIVQFTCTVVEMNLFVEDTP
jgi:hypothetical protein